MSRTDRFHILVDATGRAWEVVDGGKHKPARRAARHAVWLERALCRLLRLHAANLPE